MTKKTFFYAVVVFALVASLGQHPFLGGMLLGLFYLAVRTIHKLRLRRHTNA